MAWLWYVWDNFGQQIFLSRHFFTEVLPLALIAWFLYLQKKGLKELVGDLERKIDTLRKTTEAGQENQTEALAALATLGTGGDSIANWSKVSEQWQSAKNRVELAIELIKRKNTREKYSRFTRHRYAQIVRALQNDSVINEKTSLILQNMELRFLTLRGKPRETTASDAAQFVTWISEIGSTLPGAEDKTVG
jgi:hypothetical protein